MSRKLKNLGLFGIFLVLVGLWFYLLKDNKSENVTSLNNENNSNLSNAQYYNRLGNSLMMEKKFNESITAFNKSIELSKNTKYFYVPYSGRAHTKYNLHDCNGVISDANTALSGDKTIWDMYNLIGICEYSSNKYKDALEHFNTAISLAEKNDPFLWLSYAYRGATESQLNDFENAKKDLDNAMKLNNKQFFIFNAFYIYYMKINEYKNAAIYFENAANFTGDIDYTYYQDGIRIYIQLFYLEKDKKDIEGMKKYGKIALENINKAYKLKPNVKNGYWLCLIKTELNHKDSLQFCKEELSKAKQEKNDSVYQDILEIIN